MKGNLTFSLPEELEEFQVAIDGGKWKSTVLDLNETLRKWLKYGITERVELTEIEEHIVSEIRDELDDILDFRGLSLE